MGLMALHSGENVTESVGSAHYVGLTSSISYTRGSIQVSGGATAKSGEESEKLCRLGVRSSVPHPRTQRVNHRLPELLSKLSTRFRLCRVGPCDERQLCEGDSVQLARQQNSHVMGRVCYVFVWVKEKIWG